MNDTYDQFNIECAFNVYIFLTYSALTVLLVALHLL